MRGCNERKLRINATIQDDIAHVIGGIAERAVIEGRALIDRIGTAQGDAVGSLVIYNADAARVFFGAEYGAREKQKERELSAASAKLDSQLARQGGTAAPELLAQRNSAALELDRFRSALYERHPELDQAEVFVEFNASIVSVFPFKLNVGEPVPLSVTSEVLAI